MWIAAEAEGKPIEDEKGERHPIRDPENKEDVPIYVLFDASPDDFELSNENTQLQVITLPPAGKGDSTKACLKLRPKRVSSSERDLATVAVHFFYNFSAVESVEIKAEVLEEGDDLPLSHFYLSMPIKATYRKLGDWVQLEDVDRREMTIFVNSSGNDRYQLTFAYGGLEYKGALRLTKQELEDIILEIREKLEYLAVDQNSPIKHRKRYAFKTHVHELAELGGILWVKLFESEENKSLWQTSQFLKQFPVETGGTIQVIIKPDAAGFMFPWNLLYDGEFPLDSKAVPEDILEGFWGMRYCIEQAPLDRMERKWRCKPVQLGEHLMLSFMLKKDLPNADAQKRLMADLAQRSQHKIAVNEPIINADACFNLLRDNDSDILYFYSRGYTRRRRADIAFKPDTTREKSHIELSEGKLYLRQLELSKRQIALRKEPVVILNMCESAQITPSLSEGFIPFFLEQGAVAVVGTECAMTTDFAHPFAEAFFESFLRGNPLGRALLTARRKFLQPDEFMAPLGLAYALYGLATLRYKPSPL